VPHPQRVEKEIIIIKDRRRALNGLIVLLLCPLGFGRFFGNGENISKFILAVDADREMTE
jgi:hypothetical protein